MLKEGELYFNNNTSLNLNLFLEEYPAIPRANEQFEKVPVDGRNGDLIMNLGTYADREITFEFTLLSEEIETDFEAIEEWLTEIEDNRLFFGADDKCFIVKKVIIGDLEREFKTIGQSEITFLCEPFRQDQDSLVYSISESGFTFYYSGTIPSEPLIKVWGTGNIQITINGETMQITDSTGYFEIDSRLLEVRNIDGTSKDDDVLGDFAVFEKGENTIEFIGNVIGIDIEFTTMYR